MKIFCQSRLNVHKCVGSSRVSDRFDSDSRSTGHNLGSGCQTHRVLFSSSSWFVVTKYPYTVGRERRLGPSLRLCQSPKDLLSHPSESVSPSDPSESVSPSDPSESVSPSDPSESVSPSLTALFESVSTVCSFSVCIRARSASSVVR